MLRKNKPWGRGSTSCSEQLLFYVPGESSVKTLGMMGGVPEVCIRIMVEFVGAEGGDWENLSLVCKSFQFVVSDWRFKSFKAVTLSAASPEKALYFGARLPQTHPNHPRLKNASRLLIHLEKGFDDLDHLQDLLLSGRDIAAIMPALESLIFSSNEDLDAEKSRALLGAMDLPPSAMLVLESTDERVRILNLDGLPPTLQRLSIMHSAELSGSFPVQLKHLEVLLVTYQPPQIKFTTDEEIRDAATFWINNMFLESDREILRHVRPELAARMNAMSYNATHAVPVSPKLFLGMIPPSLETLVLLFDEGDLDFELPALIDPDDLLNLLDLVEEFDTGPPQAPPQQLANRLDGEYKFTGSLQHAASLRLVHCKVLYSGEVPTHSLLELERLRSHVSSRCKAAATVVFKVSSIKKPV